MKQSRFSEEQIIYAFRQAESGTPIGMSVSSSASPSKPSRLEEEVRPSRGKCAPQARQWEEKNRRLKRLVADLELDKHILSEALRKAV